MSHREDKEGGGARLQIGRGRGRGASGGDESAPVYSRPSKCRRLVDSASSPLFVFFIIRVGLWVAFMRRGTRRAAGERERIRPPHGVPPCSVGGRVCGLDDCACATVLGRFRR